MGDIFMKTIIFCGIIGIMTTCFALLNLAKISKEHKNLNDEEYLYKVNRLIRKRNKYLIMGIVGMTIASLMQIIIIFTR